jgi:hypothetical protein
VSITVAQQENDSAPNSEEIKIPAQRVSAASEGSLVVQVDLPAGYHLNPAAPQRYKVSVEAGLQQLTLQSDQKSGAARRDKTVTNSAKDLRLPLRVPFRTLEPGNAELRVQLTLFYCREDNTGTCRIKTLVWRAPIEVTSAPPAPTEIRLQGKLTAE